MAGPPLARRTRLHLNTLEARETPAGEVTASVAGGVLTLTGDDADNVIQIRQTPAGIEVIGTGTFVDGPDQPFVGVSAIRAAMRDGNDVISLDPTGNFTLSGVSTFDLGDGDNFLQLVSGGRLDLGGLTVLAGDGADVVTIAGAPAAGSVIRNSLSFSMGIGKNSQEPPYRNTQVRVTEVDVLGAGGLRLTGTEGDEELFLQKVNVRFAANLNGGDGALVVNTTDSRFGSLILAAVGPEHGLSTNAVWLTGLNTVVSGPLSLTSQRGANLQYTGGSARGVMIATGPSGDTSAEFSGATTITGNLTVRGNRHTVSNGDAGAELTVTGDISITATSQATLSLWDGSVRARNVTLTGTGFGGANLYVNDSGLGGPASGLTTTGSLTLRGRTVEFLQQAGEVSVGGRLTLAAGTEATFSTGTGFFSDGPVAKTSVIGPALVQGRRVEFQQTESEATFGANLTLQGTEWTQFETNPWRLEGDPNEPDSPPFGAGARTTVAGSLVLRGREVEFDMDEGTAEFGTGLSLLGTESARFDTAPKEHGYAPDGSDVYGVGAKVTVTGGGLTMQGESADYFQVEGDSSFARGMSLVSRGSAQVNVESGFVEVPGGGKLAVPGGGITVQGPSAAFLVADATATVAGGITVRGTEGAQFNLESFDTGDRGSLTTGGAIAVDAGIGDVMFAGFGQSLDVGGDLSIGGRGHNRLWLDSVNGTQIGGDIRVAGATGDRDWFIVGSSLTVAGNTSVALGGGANAISFGLEEGTVQLGGDLTLTTGSGSDVLTLAAITVAGRTTINTGAGADRLHFLKDAVFNGTVSADLGGGADTFEAALPYDGFDPIPAGPVTFHAAATVRMGAGNDTLRLGVAGDPNGRVQFGPGGTLLVDGGLNLDLFDDEAGQFDASRVTTPSFDDPTP